MLKLVVIEPWEFGTWNGEGPFSVNLIKGANGNWLLVFINSAVKCEGYLTKYLLCKPQKWFEGTDLSVIKFNTIIVEMAYIQSLNLENFMGYDLNNHRGRFFIGELSQEK